jgi:hypothetical protein
MKPTLKLTIESPCKENFKKFADGVNEKIISAGPK